MNVLKHGNRLSYIDVLKGFLIIAVVLGHATNSARIVFWFHMPIFFMISGFLYFIPNNFSEWIIKKTKRYLIPYFSYYVFVTIFIEHKLDFKNFIRFLYGGRFYSGAWWFTTCLLLTLIIFTILNNNIAEKKIFIVIITCFILGVLESNLFIPQDKSLFPIYLKMPWNIDVCLLSLFYLSIGFYFKNQFIKLLDQLEIQKIIYSFMSIGIIIVLIIAKKYNFYNFELDMKYSQYTNAILIIIVPLCCGYLLLLLSYLVSLSRFNRIMSLLGRNSMSIMYLHVGILTVLKATFGNEDYKCFVYTVVAILVSCLFSEFMYRNKLTKKLFITGEF